MPHRNPKYVRAYTDNRGKRRYYFRRKGVAQVPLPAPWEPGFLEAYNAAATNKAPAGKTHIPSSGTLGAVIVQYLGSQDYKALAASTQGTYRRLLDRLGIPVMADRHSI